MEECSLKKKETSPQVFCQHQKHWDELQIPTWEKETLFCSISKEVLDLKRYHNFHIGMTWVAENQMERCLEDLAVASDITSQKANLKAKGKS